MNAFQINRKRQRKQALKSKCIATFYSLFSKIMLNCTEVPFIFCVHILIPSPFIYKSINYRSYYLLGFKIYTNVILHVNIPVQFLINHFSKPSLFFYRNCTQKYSISLSKVGVPCGVQMKSGSSRGCHWAQTELGYEISLGEREDDVRS